MREKGRTTAVQSRSFMRETDPGDAEEVVQVEIDGRTGHIVQFVGILNRVSFYGLASHPGFCSTAAWPLSIQIFKADRSQ
jgi:hypothetical protein